MKRVSILAVIALMVLGQAFSQTIQKVGKMNNEEHYTFKLRDKVTRQKVSFKNRYGITISADLYVPKNIGNNPLSAVAISGPFGAVKEQSSGLYQIKWLNVVLSSSLSTHLIQAKVVANLETLGPPKSIQKILVQQLTF